MSDYFGQGDNGTLQKLMDLLNKKQEENKPLPSPTVPAPFVPVPNREPAIQEPMITPSEMEQLEQQKRSLDMQTPVTTNDDKLMQLIRTKLAARQS